MNNVSIVIPSYNEEESIGKVLEEILSLNGKYEVIVVDDASTDRTISILENFRPGIKIIRHNENRGYGASLKTGAMKAKNDIIVITDGDGTYPNEAIPELLKHIDEYDMVVGARNNIDIPLIRRPAKWFIKRLAEYLTGIKIPDLNSGLRVIKKDVINKYLSFLPDGFSLTTTITLAMLTNGYNVKYIPIDYYKRAGESKIRPIKDTMNFLQLVVRTVLYFDPLKIFIPLSIILFIMSGAVLILSYLFTPKVMDITTVILFVAGLQMLAIGMIADLIDKRIK